MFNSVNNRGVSECSSVTVVTDTELVCTLILSGVPEDAYFLTLVEDGVPGSPAANPTIMTSGSAFIVAPY